VRGEFLQADQYDTIVVVSWPEKVSVVRSQRVVTPEGVRPAAIHIESGLITRVVRLDDAGRAAGSVLDADELVVMPGLVDTHVHINEPGRTEWEGFETATRAAAAGGVTTVIDMPLNSIPATTTERALAQKRDSAIGKCAVDVGFLGGVVPGNERELAALWDAGVFAFKCFLIPSGVDEFRNVAASDLERALPVLVSIGATLMVHAELAGPIEQAWPALADRDARVYATYLASRPVTAETDAIRLVAELARKHRASVHVVHVSAAESVTLLRESRARGIAISAETCPHYLTLASSEVPDGATEFKCAPPIREPLHRDALWEGLHHGALDLIVTDHSPCPPALKQRDVGDFFHAWGGISSLELSLPVVWTEMHRRGLDIGHVARWMASGPARLVGLHGRKGAIAPGADADLVLLDPAGTFAVDASTLFQRHKTTPYDRRELRGRVRATYLRGSLIFADGEAVGERSGRLLSRHA
jgi:allantoinase